MLLELLVLYSCSNGLQGCSEARTAYFHNNKQVIDNVNTRIKNNTHTSLQQAAPVIAAIYKKQINFPVNNHISIILGGDKIETKFIYKIDF